MYAPSICVLVVGCCNFHVANDRTPGAVLVVIICLAVSRQVLISVRVLQREQSLARHQLSRLLRRTLNLPVVTAVAIALTPVARDFLLMSEGRSVRRMRVQVFLGESMFQPDQVSTAHGSPCDTHLS